MNSPSVKEIQINSDGSLEISYKPNSAEAITIASSRGLYIPENVEMISQDKGNVVFVFGSEETDDLMDYYAIKYQEDGIQINKHYTKKFWEKPNIQLPRGSRLANQFGIGYYSDRNVFDMYFFHDNQAVVEKHFDMKIGLPYSEELHYYRFELGLYGVTYDDEHNVINLKRYLYPFDPYCKNPSYI